MKISPSNQLTTLTEQVLAIRERLNLTQAEAAQLFGGGPMAFSKYERGETSQSVPMDRLLRLVSLLPGLVDSLCVIAGVEPRFGVANQPDYADAHPVRLQTDTGVFFSRKSLSVTVAETGWELEEKKKAA